MTARLSAELRSPNDLGLVAPSLGDRLASVRFETACNAGYSQAAMRLLGSDGGELVPEAESSVIKRLWRFCVLRLALGGEPVWTGRIWKIRRGPRVLDAQRGWARTVSLECRGFWADLTLKRPDVDGDYQEEDATVTLTELVRSVVAGKEAWWLIEENYISVVDTGVNVGPISPALTDDILSLLLAGVRAGSSSGLEPWFAIFEPVAGPLLQLRGDAAPRWRMSLSRTGLGDVWDGEEYVSVVTPLYTDQNGSSQVGDDVVSTIGAELHHDVTSQRALSLDRVNADGAATGAQTYLALHEDPVGLVGPLVLRPEAAGGQALVEGAQGSLEPAWRVRCGDVVELYDLDPHDPYLFANGRLLRFVVERTAYDVEAGTMEIELDQRALHSRLHESPAQVRHLLAALEPASTRKLLVNLSSDTNQTIAGDTAITTIGDNGFVRFAVTRRTNVVIIIEAALVQTSSASSGNESMFLGYEIDGEGWDSNLTDERIGRYAYDEVEVTAKHFALQGERILTPGAYTIRCWASETLPNTVELRYIKLRILG